MTSQPKLEAAPFSPHIEDPTPFPDAERVIYKKNPLEVVICQLHFPAILRISSAPPAEFQEPLRQAYPLFRETPPVTIPTGWPSEIAAIAAKLMPGPSAKAYELSSSDQNWQVTLTQESIALSCKKYSRWEEFVDHLDTARSLLERIYKPTFYTRIGLRYKNVILPSTLGLKGVPWDKLMSHNLAGEFHSGIAPAVEATGHTLVLRLQGDAAKVTLQHGLGNKENEVCYIIDSDFFVTEHTGVGDASKILGYFNRQAGRLFKWCIADELHWAMEPVPVH